MSSESQILLNRNATPLGTFSILFLGKQVLGSTYMNLPVLHSSHEMLQVFPEKTVNVTYRRNKNLY